MYAYLEKKAFEANSKYLLAQIFIKEINLVFILIQLKSWLSGDELIITSIGVLKHYRSFALRSLHNIGLSLVRLNDPI